MQSGDACSRCSGRSDLNLLETISFQFAGSARSFLFGVFACVADHMVFGRWSRTLPSCHARLSRGQRRQRRSASLNSIPAHRLKHETRNETHRGSGRAARPPIVDRCDKIAPFAGGSDARILGQNNEPQARTPAALGAQDSTVGIGGWGGAVSRLPSKLTIRESSSLCR